MAADINLTHHLGEWGRRNPKLTRPPAAAMIAAHTERHLRPDRFLWLAYGTLALFLLGQVALLAWLDLFPPG
jgi:hypothetical protein